MIEAQNKSCNLGYTTASALFVVPYLTPTPVLKGEGDELEGRNLESSELYVFSQTTKHFLDS